jgi:hypothetical protein
MWTENNDASTATSYIPNSRIHAGDIKMSCPQTLVPLYHTAFIPQRWRRYIRLKCRAISTTQHMTKNTILFKTGFYHSVYENRMAYQCYNELIYWVRWRSENVSALLLSSCHQHTPAIQPWQLLWECCLSLLIPEEGRQQKLITRLSWTWNFYLSDPMMGTGEGDLFARR